MSGHEGVFFVEGVENEISLEAKAEFHATGMVMEVDTLSNGKEVAESENGNAVNAVRAEVKDPITGFITI